MAPPAVLEGGVDLDLYDQRFDPVIATMPVSNVPVDRDGSWTPFGLTLT